MNSIEYRIHGLDVVVNVPVPNWPTARADVTGCRSPKWQVHLTVDDSSVLGEVPARAGSPRWRWRDLGDSSTLEVTGTPPSWERDVATSAVFTVDFTQNLITASHSHDHEVGLVDLLTRWVLPDIARREAESVPLHACAVEMDSGAVLLLGDSGLGKSSLAAALLARGAEFLGDEPICVGPKRRGRDRVP